MLTVMTPNPSGVGLPMSSESTSGVVVPAAYARTSYESIVS